MKAVPYLLKFAYMRVIAFFRHWYVDGVRFIGRETINMLESLDRTFAWRITAANLFQPLYQDHSVTGHFLGFVFRSLRLVAGSFIYVLLLIAAIGVAIAWAIIPISILWYGIRP